MAAADRILWDVQEEHLDEAAFLFEQFEGALDSPLYLLDELAAGPEARMLAHIDGLLVGGAPVVEELLLPVIEDSEADPGALFVSAYVTLMSAPTERCAAVLSALEHAKGERWRCLVRALELCDRRGFGAWLHHGLERAAPRGLAGRMRGLASQEHPVDPRASDWLTASDPEVARAACRWLACAPEPALFGALRAPLQHEDARVRRDALDAACICAPDQIWAWVVQLSERGDEGLRERALLWTALLGDASVHARLVAGLGQGASPWPVSFTGRAEAVDAAIDLLADEALGPLAGELIQAIAGLPSEDAFWADPPMAYEDEEEALPAFEDDDLEAEPVPTPQDELRLPRPDAIARWWSERRDLFDPNLRYLDGVAMGPGPLSAAIDAQPCRRRHDLALELRSRTQGSFQLETRSFSAVQRERLRALPPVQLQTGLRG